MAKILVVDDDASIVEVVQYVLQQAGHEICVARDGKAGLAMAEQERPDVIVLDVMMPELDGFSVSRMLAQNPQLKDIPVLILTAKGKLREILAMMPNIAMMMEKPFEPSELTKNVQTLLVRKSKAA